MSVARTIYHEDPEPVEDGASGNDGAWGTVRSSGEHPKEGNHATYAVRDFFAQHGWTLVLLLVMWYNLKEPVNRRWRKWLK